MSESAENNLPNAPMAQLALYRLYRLRRLIVLCAILPLPALALAMAADVAIGRWAIPLWVGFCAFHAIRFPNAWLDLIAFALTFAFLLLVAIPVGFLGLGPVFGYPTALFIGLFVWMGMLTRLHWFDQFRWPMGRMSLRRRFKLPAEQVRAAFFLRPDAEVGHQLCGPADANGVFPVTATGLQPLVPDMGFVMPKMTDEEYDELVEELGQQEADQIRAAETRAEQHDQNPPVTFYAIVLEESDTEQELILMQNYGADADAPDDHDASDDEPQTQTLIQTVTPTRNGCRYRKLETGNILGCLSGAGFFLSDADADYVTSSVAKMQGTPDISVRAAHRDTLLFMLTRYFMRRQTAKAG